MNAFEVILFTPLGLHPVIGYILMLIAFVVLVVVVWRMRVLVLQYQYIIGRKWITLEIRVPRDIERSPVAMELFLMNAMHQSGGVGNVYKKYWLGRVLNWASLEIVSFGGSVHFYIYAQSWMKDTIEAQLYSQFPQIEILEVEDYVDRIPPYTRGADFDLYGAMYKLEMPDVYPIKTYKDWGLDRHMESLETTQQIDPLTPLIEALASLRAGEEWWFQILIRANKDDSWHGKAEKEIEKLKIKFQKKIKGVVDGGEEDESIKLSMTKGESEMVNAIERKMDKFTFDVGIRTIYLAKKDAYDGNKHLYIKNAFSSFSSQNFNRLKRVTYTGFDNPWEDVNDILNVRKKNMLLEKYRARNHFYLGYKFTWMDTYMKYIDPFQKPKVILSTEELATLFHFPGRVLQTPGLQRIEARKSEPPANLPV